MNNQSNKTEKMFLAITILANLKTLRENRGWTEKDFCQRIKKVYPDSSLSVQKYCDKEKRAKRCAEDLALSADFVSCAYDTLGLSLPDLCVACCIFGTTLDELMRPHDEFAEIVNKVEKMAENRNCIVTSNLEYPLDRPIFLQDGEKGFSTKVIGPNGASINFTHLEYKRVLKCAMDACNLYLQQELQKIIQTTMTRHNESSVYGLANRDCNFAIDFSMSTKWDIHYDDGVEFLDENDINRFYGYVYARVLAKRVLYLSSLKGISLKNLFPSPWMEEQIDSQSTESKSKESGNNKLDFIFENVQNVAKLIKRLPLECYSEEVKALWQLTGLNPCAFYEIPKVFQSKENLMLRLMFLAGKVLMPYVENEGNHILNISQLMQNADDLIFERSDDFLPGFHEKWTQQLSKSKMNIKGTQWIITPSVLQVMKLLNCSINNLENLIWKKPQMMWKLITLLLFGKIVLDNEAFSRLSLLISATISFNKVPRTNQEERERR